MRKRKRKTKQNHEYTKISLFVCVGSVLISFGEILPRFCFFLFNAASLCLHSVT